MVEISKLHEQRALLISAVIGLMVKEFEEDAVNIFKMALGKQVVEVMSKDRGAIMLQDEAEQMLFKSILTFTEKEVALLNIKSILKGDQPL
jgi:hypothetical protein